jgi:S-formylglutathione hydrolase FrmB
MHRIIKSTLLAVGSVCLTLGLRAAEISKASVHSDSMNADFTAGILLPASYQKEPQKRFPVVYLLDGYSGNGTRLLDQLYKDSFSAKADALNLILVAVGCVNKWYFDSPVDASVRWQTFLLQELIPYVDAHYRTVADRKGRAITGLSMGGHGAFYTAFRNPGVFAAAASTSGGVDIRPFAEKWDLAKVLGISSKEAASKTWEENTVVNNLHKLPGAGLAIYFDCGTSDFFLNVNRDLHQRMESQGIRHEYAEFPGGHTVAYWGETFPRHMEFFAQVFARNTGSRTSP